MGSIIHYWDFVCWCLFEVIYSMYVWKPKFPLNLRSLCYKISSLSIPFNPTSYFLYSINFVGWPFECVPDFLEIAFGTVIFFHYFQIILPNINTSVCITSQICFLFLKFIFAWPCHLIIMPAVVFILFYFLLDTLFISNSSVWLLSVFHTSC